MPDRPDPSPGDEPPPIFVRLIKVALRPGVVREDVLWSLQVEYAEVHERRGARVAARWYRKQALGVASRGAWSRLSSLVGGGRRDAWPGGREKRAWGFGTDLRHAIRSLKRAPVLATVVVSTLALTIGATTAVFSLIEGVLLAPLPYPEADRLVAVYGTTEDGASDRVFNGFHSISWQDFDDLRRQANLLDDLYAYGIWPVNVGGLDGPPERLSANYVTPSYFELLGVEASAGSMFGPAHTMAMGPTPVAVISHALWRQGFDADPDAVGGSVTVNGRSLTILGVAGPGFSGTSATQPTDIWLPANMFGDTQAAFGPLVHMRAARLFFAGARTRTGVSLDQAAAQLHEIGGRLATQYRDTHDGRSFRLLPLSEATVSPGLRGGYARSAAMAMGAVSITLLIAFMNVGSLLFGRAVGRGRELAVRTAVGASRRHIARQLLTESAVLFGVGGVAGLVVARYAQLGLAALRPPTVVPSIQGFEPHLGADAYLFAGILCAGGSVVFGLVPVLFGARSSIARFFRGSGSPAIGVTRLRDAFVVGQIALSLVALIGSGLLVRSLASAQRLDLGWEPEGLGMAAFDPGAHRYTGDDLRSFYRRVLDRASSLSGVRDVAIAQLPPLTPGPLATLRSDQVDGTDERGVMARFNAVSPAYFETLGVQLRRGRTFDLTDRDGSAQVVIVNEVVADRFWPDTDPVGRTIQMGSSARMTVVGVAETGKYVAVGEEPQMAVYLPLDQAPPTSAVALARFERNTPLDLEGLGDAIRSADPGLPVFGIAPASVLVAEALWSARAGALLLTLLATTALGLSGLGVYGVVSTAVRERTMEMGLRMVLGADGSRVITEVVLRAIPVLLLGVAIGISVALGVSRVAEGLLYGVDPWDAPTFVAVPIGLVLVALLAALIPAIRAARVDPISAIRPS